MNKRRIILIPILIILIILLILLIAFGISTTNKQNEQIKKAALKWYYDTEMLYNKLTVGKLFENGYIDNTKTKILNKDIKCKVINIENDVVTITKENNCDLDKSIKNIPTIEVKLYAKDTNQEYVQTYWTSSDLIVKPIYNKNFDKNEIEKTYITLDYEEVFDDLIITTDNITENTYELNVLLKDGSLFKKEFRVMIDKTAPKYVSKNITDDNYEAIFEDEESGIQNVLYYVSENNDKPTSTDQFNIKESLEIMPNKKYYVYAIGINMAGKESEPIYIGEYTKKIKFGKSGSAN